MIGVRLGNLSIREKVGIAIAVLAIVVLAADALVAGPLVARLSEIDRQIAADRNRILVARGVLTQGDKVFRRMDQVRERLGAPSSSSDAMTEMKDQIDEAARRAGLKVLTMEDRERRGVTNSYDEYSAEIGKLEGDEVGVLRLINDLSDLRGMLRVARLSLAPDPNQRPGAVKGSLLITKVVLDPDSPAARGLAETTPRVTP
jgi:hypothetical protein